MIRKLTLGLLLMMAINANAQTKEKELSTAEKFSSQAGTLIERQFINIGKVGSMEIKVAKFKDLNSGTTASSLRFEYDYKGSYGSSSTKIASLDVDEIDGLIKSLKTLQVTVFPSSKEIYTEVTFRSRSGFEAGAYYSPEKSKWSTYVQVERFDKNSLMFWGTGDFATFLDLVQQAKSKL